jgi:lipoic acid synthetase
MRKPPYAIKKIDFKDMRRTEEVLSGLNLHTVCHQARCPNMSECYKRGTATFLILGDTCTRSCAFCNVKKGKPGEYDRDETAKVAEAVFRLNLKYAVITSVTRDDMEDGGAFAFAEVIKSIRDSRLEIKVEVLVPDFQAVRGSIKKVVDAKPEVFAHNVETVPSLYKVRKGADYERSLKVLEIAKEIDPAMKTKSALLMGFGEKEDEVLQVFGDLVKTGCDYISIGQYLQPDKEHAEVVEYVKPEKFGWYKGEAYKAGFKHVESGTWVRSSYMAETYNLKLKM